MGARFNYPSFLLQRGVVFSALFLKSFLTGTTISCQRERFDNNFHLGKNLEVGVGEYGACCTNR